MKENIEETQNLDEQDVIDVEILPDGSMKLTCGKNTWTADSEFAAKFLDLIMEERNKKVADQQEEQN